MYVQHTWSMAVFSFIAPQGLKFMVAYGAYFIALFGFLCVSECKQVEIGDFF